MPARLPVEVVALAGCRIVRPEGELDSHTAPELRRRLLEEVESGTRALLVDLSGLSFIDSSGLRLMVELHRRTRERSGRMRLFAASDRIAEILRLTRLDSILDLDPDRDTALREGAAR